MTKRLLTVALAITLLAPLFAATAPTARIRGDSVALSLPAEILAQSDVRKQIDSGLTTTFAVVATLEDEPKRTGGVRIDIRFEPWDEVYYVTTRSIGSQPQTQRIASFAALQAWWRDAALTLFTHTSAARSVQVSIDVLPFSVEEQQETQRWLTRTLGESRQPPATGGDPSADTSSVLDLVIGTSIKRRPIRHYRWQVRVAP